MNIFHAFRRPKSVTPDHPTSPPAVPAPVQSRKRHQTRSLKHTLGSGSPGTYQAGKVSRLTSTQPRFPLSADAAIYQSLRVMRARSRAAGRNQDHQKRFLGLCRTHIVGPSGIGLQVRAKNNDGTPDTLGNDAVEQAWKDWGDSDTCDIEQQLSFTEMLHAAVTTVAEDGEALIRIITTDRNPFGLAFQLLDPELLDLELNTETTAGGGWIRMGIEFNAFGVPVAYHLIRPNRNIATQRAPGGPGIASHIIIPAEEMIHLYLRHRTGQSRGVPWSHTALYRMLMLSGFQDAAITNARHGAQNLGVLTNGDGDLPGGTEQDSDGAGVMDSEDAEFIVAPDGYSFDKFESRYPTGEFEPFTKGIKRDVASGQEVNYHTLTGDLSGISYSSIRQGVLEDHDLWKTLQAWLIRRVCRRIYNVWLPLALLSGMINVAGTPLKVGRVSKFKRITWQGRRWDWVDPLKDLKANALAVASNFASTSEIIRDRGRDPEEVWTEIESDRKRLEFHGLTPPTENNSTPKGSNGV